MLPGFIATEGFPQSELTEKPRTRWIVSTPERAAEAIYQAGIGRTARALRAAPLRHRRRAARARPRLVRRVLGGGAATVMTTTTGADLAERRNGAGPAAGAASVVADGEPGAGGAGSDAP